MINIQCIGSTLQEKLIVLQHSVTVVFHAIGQPVATPDLAG